jgi:hypothetical protein
MAIRPYSAPTLGWAFLASAWACITSATIGMND